MRISNQLFKKRKHCRESYSKHFNILIHGVDELKEVAVETKKQTKEIFEQFLGNALEIDPQSIGIVDVHRLPQHKVARSRNKIRPIIVKVQSAFDKALIFENAKKLKSYNEERRFSNRGANYIYFGVLSLGCSFYQGEPRAFWSYI